MIRKSFVLFTEYGEKLARLTDEQLGALFRLVFAYVETGTIPTVEDQMIGMAFDFIRADLDRQAENYTRKVEAGRKGGVAKASTAKQKLAEPSMPKQSLAEASTIKQNVAEPSTVYLNKNKNKNVNKNVNKNIKEYIPSFFEFWNLYPRKIGKATAEAAYKKKCTSAEVERQILDGVRRYNTLQWSHWSSDRTQYIPHPTTWLNQERWKDEVEPYNGKHIPSYMIEEPDEEPAETDKAELEELLAKFAEHEKRNA